MRAGRVELVTASPWTTRQRVVLAVLLGVGVVGLVAGYTGTSGTLRVSRQVAWLNVAGAGLVVSGVGVVVFLTAGRRRIGRRRLGLFGNLNGDSAAPAMAGGGSATDLMAAPAMTRYHRVDCEFVAGKRVRPASAAEHRRAGRRPCGICLGGEVGGE